MGFNLWTAKKRRQYVIDICGSLEIKYRQNMFEVEILESELPNLSEFIVRLTQACIRITDLSFTQKLQTFATFETEIEEFIDLAELPYESDPPDLIGSYGKPVKVDFKVSGHRINSLIQTWSTRQTYTAHTTSNEIYVRWLALKSFRDSYQFITVYDDSSPNAREDDYARLFESSEVFAFPTQREQFLEAIKA